MSERINLDSIAACIELASRGVEREIESARGADDYERATSHRPTICQARAQLRELERQLPRLQSLSDVADRAYDRHVTGPEPEGCSCHISPPCAFCVGQNLALRGDEAPE